MVRPPRQGFGLFLRLVAVAVGLAGPVQAGTVYEAASAQVVCIETANPDKSRSVGAGFFIRPGVIASVRHLLVGARHIRVHLPNGAVQEGRVIAQEKATDLALLRVPFNRLNGLSVGRTTPRMGDEVFTIGCPLGLSRTLSKGMVTQPQRAIDGKRLLQTDLATSQGNSGGPLVNRDGEVVGVVHGQMREAAGINFGVLASDLTELMMANGLSPAALTPEQEARLALLWGEARNAASHDSRIAAYQQVLMVSPDMAEAYYNMGLAYLAKGDYERAGEIFETASLKRQNYVEALNNQGLSLILLGRYKQARDVLVRALSIQADYALAYLNLGVVYSQGLKDHESADKNFRRYLQLEPNSAQAPALRRWLEAKTATPCPIALICNN